MEVSLLFGGTLIVLIRYSLAGVVYGVHLEDRFRKLETEMRQGDSEHQGRLRKLETEMLVKDREILLYKNQIIAERQKTMDNFLTEAIDKSNENLTVGTTATVTLDDKLNIPLTSQYDMSPRAVAEPVAFYVYLNSSRCFHDYESIVYNVEVTNTRRTYNHNDGIFTVPITGTYAFAITIVPEKFKWVSNEIVCGGKSFGGAIGDSEGLDSHNPGSITIVVRLQVGARVFVRRNGASGSCATYSLMPLVTSFAGWLIG